MSIESMYPRLQPPKILLLERVISVALHVSAALHCDRKSPLAVNVIGHKAHLQATCCTRLRWNPWHLPLFISIWYILFYYPDVSCVCVCGGGDFCHIAPAIILWDEAKNKDRKMLVGHWENERMRHANGGKKRRKYTLELVLYQQCHIQALLP